MGLLIYKHANKFLFCFFYKTYDVIDQALDVVLFWNYYNSGVLLYNLYQHLINISSCIIVAVFYLFVFEWFITKPYWYLWIHCLSLSSTYVFEIASINNVLSVVNPVHLLCLTLLKHFSWPAAPRMLGSSSNGVYLREREAIWYSNHYEIHLAPCQLDFFKSSSLI